MINSDNQINQDVNQDGGDVVDPWGISSRSLAIIPLLIIFILLCLSGCASNPSPVTNPSPSIDNHTTIKLAFGLGCVQLAKRHPSSIPTYLADLTITQSTLDSGTAPYSLIESLAIKSIKSSPEEMVIIQPALDELTSRYFPQSSGIPIKGSAQYDAIEAAIMACRGGLNAVAASIGK